MTGVNYIMCIDDDWRDKGYLPQDTPEMGCVADSPYYFLNGQKLAEELASMSDELMRICDAKLTEESKYR